MDIWNFFNLPAKDLKKKTFEDLQLKLSHLSKKISPQNNAAEEADFVKQNKVIFVSSRTKIKNLKIKNKKIDLKIVSKIYFTQNKYQDQALRAGYLEIQCPLSRQLVKSSKSFSVFRNSGEFSYLYRFESDLVYYLGAFPLSRGYPITFIFIPNLELILIASFQDAEKNIFSWRNILKWSYRVIWISKEEKLKSAVLEILNKFRSNVVNEYEHYFKYLINLENPKTVVHVSVRHFIHHAWNVLSGIERVVGEKLISCISKFIVSSEPLGKLDFLFPEISADKIDRIDEAFIPRYCVQKNYFVVACGDTKISHGLQQRIFLNTTKVVSPEFKAKVIKFKQEHFPLIWITVKCDDRTPLNQVTAFSSLILSLKKKYPQLGVIFDGVSMPNEIDSVLRKRLSENMVSEVGRVILKIQENISQRSVDAFSISGNLIGYSFFAMKYADVYLAHAGTMQNKIGWFAQVPGVVHSNWVCLLSRAKEELSRCNLLEGQYLPAYSCITLPQFFRRGSRLNADNYFLFWQVAEKSMSRLISNLRRSAS